MGRKSEPREIPADFIAALEQGVRDVLRDPKATPNQRLQAVSAGVKLEFLRHKIKEPSDHDEPGSFFGNGASPSAASVRS